MTPIPSSRWVCGASALVLTLAAGCGRAANVAPQTVPAAPAEAVSPAQPARAVSGAPQVVQPGRPGEESTVVPAAASARASALPHTAADTKFMQGMIGHHAQALEMSALVYTNSESQQMKLLAKRIEVSQLDEIGMMKTWLTARRETLPNEHAHHAGDHALMAGMLTQAEMRQLADTRGAAFDRLFLAGMIKHHQGALTMVKELFATPKAAQEAEIFAFAADVDADQRMEIDRMAAMLAALR